MHANQAMTVNWAERFYGGKICAVTRSEPTETHWHHLDEDPSNWHPTNIIPLAASLSTAIELHRRNPMDPLPYDLEIDALRLRARAHYQSGRFAQAYACARVGAFLTTNHTRIPDHAVTMSNLSLHSIRPLWEIDLVVDTIRRTVWPSMRDPRELAKVSLHTRAALALEIASYFEVAGYFESSILWQDLAQFLIGHARSDYALLLTQASIHQRRGIVLLGQRDGSAKSYFRSSTDLYAQSGLPYGLTQDALWRVRGALLSSDVERAVEAFEESRSKFGWPASVIGQRLGQYSWWPYLELRSTEADLALSRGRHQDSMDIVKSSYHLFQMTGVVPMSILPSRALEEFEGRYVGEGQRLRRRTLADLRRLQAVTKPVWDVLAKDPWTRQSPYPVEPYTDARDPGARGGGISEFVTDRGYLLSNHAHELPLVEQIPNPNEDLMNTDMASDIKRADIGIITIREDELAAILQRFPDKLPTVSGHRRYRMRRLQLSSTEVYTVAVLRCVEQGNGEAQAAARDLLEDLAPSWVFVVGIAGGVPANEFSLGDVIVSTRIADFSVEAVLKDHSREYALAGGPLHPEVPKWVADIRSMVEDHELDGWNDEASIGRRLPPVDVAEDKLFYGDNDWKSDVREKIERRFVTGPPRPPLVTTGAIASSDRLIKEAEILGVCLKFTRQVQAVEMESAGVYRATYSRQIPFLAIRGISDVIGFKRHPDWTEYACHSAAAFTLVFLRALLRARAIKPR